MLTVRRYIRSSKGLNATFNNNLFVSKLLTTIYLTVNTATKFLYHLQQNASGKQILRATEQNIADMTALEQVKWIIKLMDTYVNMTYLE